ncbi:hypothetical protein HF521_014843, partial [Silurus meridionalis]
IIIVLGVVGNGVVIWIAGFKMKKTINTTWYLSLAISDFIFCATLPFNTFYIATEDWIFGHFMCRLTSFVMFLNMFSSIFLLVIISMDRCIAVMFPVWAQNQRTIKKASLIVLIAWVLSVSLSMPSAIFRDVQHHLGRTRCHNNYFIVDSHKYITICRFIFGFLIPFLFIMVCYSVIICKLRSNQMAKSTKPFKIMTALIVTFFFCWVPYHTFVLAELNQSFPTKIIIYGLSIGTSMASANSFLNPILYVFMGNDFRQKFKNSILSKIENAIGEEGRTMSRYLSLPAAPTHTCTDAMCVFLATVNVIMMLLGITGNGLVIWIAGFKIKKTVNTVWYLSLAVSDFLFCVFLPFNITYMVKSEWSFGLFMCKLTSFILFLNMFSSIFLLVIISLDRCVAVMFPVWAQNKRTIRLAWVMVLAAWIVSAMLSSPAAHFRDVHTTYHRHSETICYYNYAYDEQHIAIVLCRFIFGFAIPLLVIIICYAFIIQKLKYNQTGRSNKPFKVMTALIAAFFICWLPYHIFNLLEINVKNSIIQIGQQFGTTLASANSFMNPFLYAFMGKDFKRKFY